MFVTMGHVIYHEQKNNMGQYYQNIGIHSYYDKRLE